MLNVVRFLVALVFAPFVVLALGYWATPLHAQSALVVLDGAVEDGPGSPAAGATVTLRGNGVTFSTTTDAHGRFVMRVEAGSYELAVRRTGEPVRVGGPIELPPGRRAHVHLHAGEPAAPPAVGLRRQTFVDGVVAFTLDQTWLDALPLSRTSVLASHLELSSSIADGSILGAGAGTATTRRIDGIDVSDPLDGRIWTSPIATTVDTFQVRLAGAGASEAGASGGIVDVVTRSGGTTLAGFVDARGTAGALTGGNIGPDLIASNPLLADVDAVESAVDASAWIGGPLRPRATFAAAFGYLHDRTDPSGPRTKSRATTPRGHGRLAITFGPSSVVTSALLFEHQSRTGVAAPSVSGVVTDAVASEVEGRTIAGRLGWQQSFAARGQLAASYTFLDGTRALHPLTAEVGHLDVATGSVTGSQGETHDADRRRHLAAASILWPIAAGGSHLLEAGFEVDASRIGERTHFIDDTFFIDAGGRPISQIDWTGSQRRGDTRRLSLHAQNDWSPAARLSIAVGLRVDRLRGATPDLGTVYATTAVQPRAGATVDLTGSGRTLARFHVGQYNDPLWFSHYDRATPGVAPMITYDLLPGGARREVERVTTPVYAVDASLRHPRTRQLTVGLEHAVFRTVVVAATVVVRDVEHLVDAVYPESRWVPTVRPGLDNQPITVYRWVNRAESEGSAIITNVDGTRYAGTSEAAAIGSARATRRYRGLVIDARYASAGGRTEVAAGWTIARSDGTVDNTPESSIGRSWRFASPAAALVNVDGRSTHTPAHKIAALGTLRIPWVAARLSAVYVGRSGRRYAAVRQYSATLDFPQSADGRQVLLEPRGARTLAFDHALDLRADYAFGLGRGRALSVYVDLVNVLNRATVLAVSPFYPVAAAGGAAIVTFDAPVEIRAPRQLFIGARCRF